jgi:hypothetical protein
MHCLAIHLSLLWSLVPQMHVIYRDSCSHAIVEVPQQANFPF